MKNARERILSSSEWIHYFSDNNHRLMKIPWEQGVCFTEDERAAIAESVREFQLGESGEGRHFLAVAQRWADRTGDAAYPEALRMFIAEEQRHARDLGRVLDRAGIPRATSLAVDTIFRHLRKLAGLELCIVVLVTAEIVAQVYYRALANATGSVVLRTLCRQILRDEVQHVRFQCQRLAILRSRCWGVRCAASVGLQWLLLGATSLVVWHKHRPVLRRGGMGLLGFWKQLAAKMRAATPLMRPAHRERSRTEGSDPAGSGPTMGRRLAVTPPRPR